MLRTIGIIILVLISCTTEASAQPKKSHGFVNVELTADSSDVTPTINAGWSKSFGGKFGLSSFMLITNGWEEVYAGPTWSPFVGLSLSLSVGVERADISDFQPRFATSVFASHENITFFGVFEWDLNGTDGMWYKVVGTYQVTDWLKIGVEGRRFKGIGPHFSASLWNTQLNFWASWVPFDPEGNSDVTRTMMGLKYGF